MYNINITSINMSKVFIGLDLSKEFHVAKALDVNGNLIGSLSTVINNEEGFKGFHAWVDSIKKKTGEQNVLIGMEPTGIYWQRIMSYVILKMDNCEAFFVKQEKVQTIRKLYDNGNGKNDHLDALSIARCVKGGVFFKLTVEDDVFKDLKKLSRLRDDYLKRISYTYNKLDNEIFNIFPDYRKVFVNWSAESLVTIMVKYPLPQDIDNASEEEIFEQLRTRVKSGVGIKKISQLKAVVRAFIENSTENLFSSSDKVTRIVLNEYLNEYVVLQQKLESVDKIMSQLIIKIPYVENIINIKGVGVGTVSALIGEFGDLKKFNIGKQLISYVGFDLKECSSGSKKGKVVVSKCGSRKLRNILYKVSLPLITQNEYFKKLYVHYTKRTENPLKKTQALIAICCKFLRVIHGMIKTNTKFNGLEVIKGCCNTKLAA